MKKLMGCVIALLIVAGCAGQGYGGRSYVGGTAGADTMRAEDFSESDRSGVTLVYFSKAGCPACKMQEPRYEAALKMLPGGSKATKVYPHMVDLFRYNVTELPTMVIYRNGTEVRRYVGVTSEDKLVDGLKSSL
jgi:thioredoxin 1